MNYKIIILIPCYNEEKTIEKFIGKLDKTGKDYLIVDDGSTDTTPQILRKLNEEKAIYTFGYKENRGKGYAIKTGTDELKNFEYILIMDADGQMSLDDISQFENALKTHPDAKIIMGNRLHNPEGMSLIRLWTNKIMSWIISRMAGQKIIDSQCGFRLVHKDIFKLNLKSDNFEFESEMLVKAGRTGYKIISVPVKCIYEKNRKSKINPIRDTWNFVKLLIKLNRR